MDAVTDGTCCATDAVLAEGSSATCRVHGHSSPSGSISVIACWPPPPCRMCSVVPSLLGGHTGTHTANIGGAAITAAAVVRCTGCRGCGACAGCGCRPAAAAAAADPPAGPVVPAALAFFFALWPAEGWGAAAAALLPASASPAAALRFAFGAAASGAPGMAVAGCAAAGVSSTVGAVAWLFVAAAASSARFAAPSANLYTWTRSSASRYRPAGEGQIHVLQPHTAWCRQHHICHICNLAVQL